MIVEGIGQSIPRGESALHGDDNFDRVMQESEEELARIARQHPSRSVKDKLLELDEVALRNPQIDNDPTFRKLKTFLKKFTVRADECIQSGNTHFLPEFSFQMRLHDCLRNMLREIVHTDDINRQRIYLTRVYKWFFNKMSSIGAVSIAQKQKEDEFMNPDKYAEIEKQKEEEIKRKKARLRDEVYNAQVEKGWFEAGERTIHKDIIPAKDRIEFYKRKLPKDPNQSIGESSTRPTTKASTTRVRTAGTRADSVYGQSFRPSFNTFYTTGEEVKYNNLMKVESKSSYMNYVPTDNVVEQKLEKMWRETKNKEIAEKRCNDELQHTLKEWGDAKSRYEEDLQRKSENMWFGSNFVARAFIRKTKTKKIDFNRNHLAESDGSSLMSDSELEETRERDATRQEDEGEGEDEVKMRAPKDRPYTNQATRPHHVIQERRERAQTAGRAKRKPFMPRLIDTSQDAGDKLVFPNIDPKGAQELAELNAPKPKPAAKAKGKASPAKARSRPNQKAKPKPKMPEPFNPDNDMGGIRPRTTDAGKRRINLLRRFHGDLIGAKNNNMEIIDNVFVSGAQDVISLSVYNNQSSIKTTKFTQSAATLPNAKLRPQSAPFKFADGFAFNQSIRRDKREELAEIDSLKTRLARDDNPVKVDIIKRAYEMPEQDEFKLEGRKYPDPVNYLMVNPFPKKKKKKKKKGGKKKKK